MTQASVKKAVLETADAIAKNPNAAKLLYKAEVDWEGDVKCSSKVRNFAPVIIDEPAAFGGSDSAQSPADLILTALGSCQEIMYAALASTMDIPLNSIKVKLKGNMDIHGLFGKGKEKGVPPGFQDISYETEIESPASQEELQKLVEAVEAQCPILDTLLRPMQISGTATINGQSSEQTIKQQAA